MTGALQNGFVGTPSGPLAELTLTGFFVKDDLDELALAASVRKRQVEKTDALELSLLPTEKCNFRCVYCYESFLKGKMQRGVIDGIVAYVRRRSSKLATLQIGWFGGEPLTAPDVIAEVGARLQAICSESGTRYTSSIVTNGYCTVAFDDPTNHVGRITPEGDLLLDEEKFALWTTSGEEKDPSCQTCFFRPPCQGNACPLERIRSGSRPCPSTKATIDQSVRVIATDLLRRTSGVHKRPWTTAPSSKSMTETPCTSCANSTHIDG